MHLQSRISKIRSHQPETRSQSELAWSGASFANRVFHRFPQARLLHRPFLLLVIFTSTCSVSQVGWIASTSMTRAKPGMAKTSARTKASLAAPPCATAGFLPIETSRPAAAHHTIRLSWNASALTPDPPAGYCLYRSESNIDIKKPSCSSCQPVNPVSVAGTSCVDDTVKDGVTYYYVVRAVDRAGKLSVWSNVATAPVPASDQIKPSTAAGAPLCRVPPAGK